jgi:hypothetical protein
MTDIRIDALNSILRSSEILAELFFEILPEALDLGPDVQKSVRNF